MFASRRRRGQSPPWDCVPQLRTRTWKEESQADRKSEKSKYTQRRLSIGRQQTRRERSAVEMRTRGSCRQKNPKPHAGAIIATSCARRQIFVFPRALIQVTKVTTSRRRVQLGALRAKSRRVVRIRWDRPLGYDSSRFGCQRRCPYFVHASFCRVRPAAVGSSLPHLHVVLPADSKNPLNLAQNRSGIKGSALNPLAPVFRGRAFVRMGLERGKRSLASRPPGAPSIWRATSPEAHRA